MPGESDCLFCKVVRGEVPAERVLENEHAVAIRDINPQAPTHVLVVPRDHHPDMAALTDADPRLAGEVLADAVAVARQEGLGEGYRLVVNTGPAAGQTVGHLHVHVLGGRGLGWPPG